MKFYQRSPRFQSSEALKNILMQNRRISKQFYTKVKSVGPYPAAEVREKKKEFEMSQLSFHKFSDGTCNSSVASVRNGKGFLADDIRKINKSSMLRTARVKMMKRNKSNKGSAADEQIKDAGPEYFRRALYTVLKEPKSRLTFTKRNQLIII